MLEFVIPAVISCVTVIAATILMEYRAKKLISYAKEDLLDWFQSEQGMVFVGSLGKLFGAGAMSALGKPNRGGSLNLFGIKIPNTIVENIVTPFLLGEAQKRGLIPSGEVT